MLLRWKSVKSTNWLVYEIKQCYGFLDEDAHFSMWSLFPLSSVFSVSLVPSVSAKLHVLKKVNAWVLLLLFFNMAFEFLSAFISGKQWHHEYQGQLPRHLCRETVREIAVSVACWWVHSVFDFCIWNRDVKLVRPLDCQKEAELNHSSLDLFCASSALVLSTVALYCPYQGHKWVRDGAGNS